MKQIKYPVSFLHQTMLCIDYSTLIIEQFEKEEKFLSALGNGNYIIFVSVRDPLF